MKTILVRLEGKGPLHQRVYRGLRAAILDGRLPPRARLPSTRALAEELAVSRNVVLAAFTQLLDEGYVSSRHGSGTYVSATLPDTALAPWRGRARAPAPRISIRLSKQARQVVSLRPLPPPGAVPSGHRLAYDFRYGRPALEEFPQALWTRLVTRRARALSTRSLGYGRPRGLPPLREAIAEYLRRSRGVRASAEQVLIVSGTQQALDLAGRLLLDPGDRVVLEEPSYQAARQLFLALGARLCPTPVDEEGLRVAELPRGKVRMAYVTPSHQFPLGGVLSLARRFELLRWAEATGAYILEDDYDGEFRYDARPLEAVQGLDRAGRVLYVGSFSKVLFPSLRIGYLVIPENLMAAAASLKFLMDCATPTFEQEVLVDFLAEGHFERHLRTMRALYARRRAVILEALQQGLGDRLEVVGADAGLHLVLYLRGLTSAALPGFLARAAQHGLGIYPLAPYYLRPPRRAGIMLGYAGQTERELRAGARLFIELAREMP